MLNTKELAEIIAGSLDGIDDYCSAHGYPTPVESYRSGNQVCIEFEDGSIVTLTAGG